MLCPLNFGRFGSQAAVGDSASRVRSTSNGRPCSLGCSLQLRADVLGNQVEEQVGGDASWAAMFGLCSPRVRLRLPDQGEQP
jgi:hypothetical protein